ncbi:MAG: phosphodiester glycosidase family protein [Oscillospiraceae bacterium]|nr:phosphodiester glycosidase family protein [Oscillospiraceae bacterium]
MRGRKFEILFSLILAAFTAYALLDAFVIPRRYETVERVQETAAEELKEIQPSVTQAQPSAPQSVTDSDSGDTTRRHKRGKSGGGSTATTESASANESGGARSWSNENISVTVTQYREYDTDVYVADITLSAPEFLKTAFAGDAYGRNVKEKTSAIAAQNNAVLAINGDYYGARERGYVIRNGVLYRDTAAGGDVLAIMRDGSFKIADDRQVTAQELLDAGAVQAFSFGPALLKNGTVAVSEGEEVGKAMASNPRTAIAVLGELHYAFIVADGRTDRSDGMSLHELAEFIQRLGAESAYNLDGGGSSTMVFQGEIINRPTTSGNSLKERSVSDIVCLIP